ncbi:uncharacterized protein LOC109947016 [Prunus persica]|uniref:uncharacterized protein LOC109947016 n=1 Tax=Prunus persica TaxID=3760 RepID=UPI0009AB89E7|nr:uncharacterized protein LOC109947016 [Prunus persica]
MDFKMKAKGKMFYNQHGYSNGSRFYPKNQSYSNPPQQFSNLLLSLVMVLNVFLACSSSPSTEVWIADTGATNHMTAEFGYLSAPTSYIGSETITAANGPGQANRENSFHGPQS